MEVWFLFPVPLSDFGFKRSATQVCFLLEKLCLNLLANVAGFFANRILKVDLSRLMGRCVYVWGDVLDLQVQLGERCQGMLEMEKNLKLVGR